MITEELQEILSNLQLSLEEIMKNEESQNLNFYAVEDFEKFVTETVFAMTKRELETVKNIFPKCLVIATRHPHTQKEFDRPKVCMVVMPEEFDVRAKEAFSSMVKEISQKSEAIATVFVSEAWMVKGTPEDLPNLEKVAEEGGGLKNYPGREEVAIFNLEHIGYQSGENRMWRSELATENSWGKKKRTLGALDKKFFSGFGNKGGGRFTNLLPNRGHPNKA